jgi:lipoate---protein ligase
MLKQIDYKPKDGKLIRLDIDVDENIIKDIKITGDFFIHPEYSIENIEDLLKGKNLKLGDETLSELKNYVKENNIKMIGITIDDIKCIIDMAVDKKNGV